MIFSNYLGYTNYTIMPKPHSLPYFNEDLLKLDISKLKSCNYLSGKKISSGEITWRVRGNKIGAVNFELNTLSKEPFMKLDFTFNGVIGQNFIRLVQIESNLGKGLIWYFLCPVTGKKCRKLYHLNGNFAHREAHASCMYESQTFSKKNRDLLQVLIPKHKESDLLDKLNKKYFKKYYRGKPTKRYKIILLELQKASKITLEQYQSAFLL